MSTLTEAGLANNLVGLLMSTCLAAHSELIFFLGIVVIPPAHLMPKLSVTELGSLATSAQTAQEIINF